jgi:integrase
MQNQRTRRIKVANERGIYYRQTARGRRYEIYYADSDGKQRWKVVPGFDNLGEARQARAAIVDKLGRGERVAPEKRTLAEAAEEWLEGQEGRLRDRTMGGYRTSLNTHILPALGRRRLTDISVEDVLALIARMRAAGKSEWTIQSPLKPLSRILGHAARNHRIPANPVRQLERDEKPKPSATQRPKRILEADEIKRLLDAAPDRYRTLLTTAVFSGLRQGELLGLTCGRTWTSSPG